MNKVTSKNTQTTPSSPFVGSLYIEHNNKSYPDLTDTLTIESELDCLSLVAKHFIKKPNQERILGIFPGVEEDVKARVVFKLNIDEVKMIIKKLQEFVNVYDEYGKFSFVIGEHQSVEPYWEGDVDIDVKSKPVTVDGKQYSSLQAAPIDKLIRMVQEECDSIGIPYTMKENEE